MKAWRGGQKSRQQGQTLVLLAIIMVVVILFLGLAIDSGLAYVTKAQLSKAVDAACLTGMRNLAQGEATAQTLARNAFNANYVTGSRDATAPNFSSSWTTDANGNLQFNVNATATIGTFFIRLLPQFQTLSVNTTAQSTRAKLVMSLVLDRSGSMAGNGGGAALQSAVPTFVNLFDNINDKVAQVSFASNATVDVAMNTGFQAPITAAVKAMKFTGGTFGPGGLVLGKSQEDSVVVPVGQNVQKVVVYFTDGWPNIIQQSLACTKNSPVTTLLNFGGYDSGNSVDFFDPSCSDKNNCYPPTYGQECTTNGGNPPCCTNASVFTSAVNGQTEKFQRVNVTNDALYDAEQTANAMRAEGITVYAVGLGNDINQSFLQQIANDPASATYDPTQPVGMAAFVPDCPSAACSTELTQVFQTIAARILLRLTQ